MNSARFLILGANGQLGRALRSRFPDAHIATRDELDITNWSSVSGFNWSKIDVILNAAAYTNVDGAETAEGRIAAWQVNAQGVAHLAIIANTYNKTLVHISSEYVFDGTQSPHTETEPYSPLGVYAQSKAAGDIAATVASKHYIMRTSWVIGEGKNFVRTMISLAEKGISPSVVSDQIGRLTFTPTLVDAITHLLETTPEPGIYNVSNDGEPTSWANITRTIFADLGRNDLTVTDTTTKAYYESKPESAPRPLQSTMDLTKIKATGLKLRDWRDDLRHYIDQEKTIK